MQKRKMLHSLRFGLACDPERAGYINGKVPFGVSGFNPEELTSGIIHEDSKATLSRSRKAALGPGIIDLDA